MMMRRTVQAIAFTSIFAALLAVLPAQTPDPMAGTWKLNLTQSNFSPGPPPKGATVVIKPVGAQVNVVLDMELGTGRMIHFEYTGTQDGSDTPVPGGGLVDTVAERRINVRTVSRDDKKDGKVTRHQLSTLAADGKTLRVEIATINAQGVPVDDYQIYDKQQ
jgi:hypothetical protein